MPRRAADDRLPLRHLLRPVVARRSANTNTEGAGQGRGWRRVGFLAVAIATVTLALSGTAWLIADPMSSGAPAASTQSAPPDGFLLAAPSSAGSTTDADQQTAPPAPAATIVEAGSAGTRKAIEPATSVKLAKPFETVPIRGVYRGGGDRFVVVQHWANGTWQSFPVPAKTDSSGQFTAYVELGQPSRYQLRVLDPQSGVTSEPFTLEIKG